MINIVFFGTPQIAVNSLKYLSECDDINILAVVTQQDKEQGRGYKLVAPPVKVIAESLNIPVLQPFNLRKEPLLISELKSLKPDFFITFAFGQILSQEVLNIPKYGTINLHASLLPKYRGANPIQHAIVNGDKTTGITTMLTSLAMDAGDICLQKEIPINKSMNSTQLADIISNISPEFIYKTIKGFINQDFLPTPQDESKISFARKFNKSEGLLDFSLPAESLHNKIRGMYPWPGTFFYFNNKMIKVIKANIFESSDVDFGKIIDINKQGIVISTSSKSIIIERVKPEGKQEMDAYAWANGLRVKTGTKIGA